MIRQGPPSLLLLIGRRVDENREMYDHVRDEPIRLTSRLGFRLRRS